MKTALVTGAAGFIGNHLCEQLLLDDYKVIGVDNFITGSQENIDYLNEFPNFTFIEQDINEPFELNQKIDYIYDFACPASPVDFTRLKILIGKVCSIGTLNLLELAKRNDSIFLFASTSEVYGDPLENPQKESYTGNVNIIGPRGIYDEGKRFSESLIMAFHREYKLKTRIVRIFNTYGERMRANDGRVIPNFITQALKNEDITVQGDGSQTRSIQYVSDLIDGILKLAQSNITEPINIGNPIEMTIKELAEKIIKMTNSTSQLKYLPLPEDDPKLRCPDITKARELLGWEPKISPDEGLQRTIEWFRKSI
ncbi:MAG TPA: UDP-glucuronic acid decarboxylase family protein [Candidatus Nitrosocosmicus sp.]|nr:UDP-glucuronic acid decarboxylase family protein [Candidatus Nitrosocosmicus sp.]